MILSIGPNGSTGAPSGTGKPPITNQQAHDQMLQDIGYNDVFKNRNEGLGGIFG